MPDRRFLDARTSVLLDALRGGAATTVLVGHAAQLGFLGRWWPFDDSFQHAAVIVFFVLSGLLIQQSAAREGVTAASFARARASRILPVALFAIALSGIIFWWLHDRGLSAGDGHHYDQPSWRAVLMPLLFFSERHDGAGPVLDPPFWSLCYEVWFYAIFAAWRFGGAGRRVILVAALLLVADLPIVLLLPTWLIGVALGRWGAAIEIARPRTVLAGSIAGLALCCWTGLHLDVPESTLQALVGEPHLRFSKGFATDFPAGLFVAAAIAALAAIPGDLARLRPAARWLAGLSFTLYLTHWPILAALRVGLRGVPTIVTAGAALLVPLAVAALLSLVLEGIVPAWLRRRPLPRCQHASTSSLRPLRAG